MSSEIWKIGQQDTAQGLYENVKKAVPSNSEVRAVKVLTDICNKINAAYDEVIQDQNEYLMDIEKEDAELQKLVEETQKEINDNFTQIKKLEQKEQDGTITEEEQAELDSKKGKFNGLINDSNSQIKDKSGKLATESKERTNEQKSKISIAKNYGEVTVEKGTPLSETHVSSGFFKKLFGCTGADKKEAGDKAVEAGNNLLDKVGQSLDINEQIDGHRSNIAKNNKV